MNDEFAPIRECFIAQLHSCLETITAAIAAGDLQQAARAAHKLRGGESFGFPGIGEKSAALEDAILSGNTSTEALIRALFETAHQEVSAFRFKR